MKGPISVDNNKNLIEFIKNDTKRKKKNKWKLRHARCTYYFHEKSLAREKNDFNKNKNYNEQIFNCKTNNDFYQI